MTRDEARAQLLAAALAQYDAMEKPACPDFTLEKGEDGTLTMRVAMPMLHCTSCEGTGQHPRYSWECDDCDGSGLHRLRPASTGP